MQVASSEAASVGGLFHSNRIAIFVEQRQRKRRIIARMDTIQLHFEIVVFIAQFHYRRNRHKMFSQLRMADIFGEAPCERILAPCTTFPLRDYRFQFIQNSWSDSSPHDVICEMTKILRFFSRISWKF